MASLLFRLEREGNGQVKIVRTTGELADCLANGVFAMIFHIEGAEAIDTNLNALETLYQAGLRSLGLTWSRPNAFASGVPFAFPSSPDTGPGLTDAGKELVRSLRVRHPHRPLAPQREGLLDVAAFRHAARRHPLLRPRH